MTYRAPVADIAFTLKHAAGLKAALAEGLYGDLDEETVDSVIAEAGRYATDVIAPLNQVGDKFGTPFKDGNVTTPPGWKEAYTRLGRGRMERPRLTVRLGRPGSAAGAERSLHRDVELGVHGLWHRAGADDGGDRRAACLRQRDTQEAVSRQARQRRMDGHDAAHRAAGRLRCRRAAQQGRARRRRDLPHHGFENIHYLRRARSHRQHHSLRAGAAARCTARHQRDFAFPDPEDHAGRLAQRRARAFGRAQARHSCLTDLHHGLRRPWRRQGIPHRRGKQRHGLHVHDDEPCTACRRPAGRRHCRARDAAGPCLCPRAQARRRRRDHRLSRREAHVAHDAGPDRRSARNLLCDRHCHRPVPARQRPTRPARPHTNARRC